MPHLNIVQHEFELKYLINSNRAICFKCELDLPEESEDSNRHPNEIPAKTLGVAVNLNVQVCKINDPDLRIIPLTGENVFKATGSLLRVVITHEEVLDAFIKYAYDFLDLTVAVEKEIRNNWDQALEEKALAQQTYPVASVPAQDPNLDSKTKNAGEAKTHSDQDANPPPPHRCRLM